jgi:hypothetical protein
VGVGEREREGRTAKPFEILPSSDRQRGGDSMKAKLGGGRASRGGH